jgi:hypothetical protein
VPLLGQGALALTFIPMIGRLHEIVGIPFPLAASGKERRNVLIKVHEF